MLKIPEYNTITGEKIDLKELERYLILICHTCFVDDKLNTYRYKFKGTSYEIEITDKKIHYGNSECTWLENIYDLIKDGYVVKE